MPAARTFIYRYDGRDASEEEEIDFAGIRQIPQIGDLIYRKQIIWRVTGVYTGYGTSIPRYRVLLSHISKAQFIH